jgi:alanyl-tRNA synthetase
MRAEEIRRTFLQFFEERGHRVVPSAPLVPSDPTLMFTVAGMVPFKPYFLGQEEPPFPRAASVQKCFRTENIEDVGTNARDCTFFEMLGNFSFGDYFKADACRWAWELLTDVYGIDVDRLWISYLEGDDETAAIWEHEVGVAKERIVPFPKEDNFWHMGVAGPCGPCTEIYIDRGQTFGPDGRPSRADEPKNQRYQEIYNLVFMQYVQDEPFHVVGELGRKGVDTGMGLERLTQILQGIETVFDTDLFTPIIARAEELTGLRRDASDEARRTLEIVADHARSVTMLLADGVTPSNEGRGYVLRRVLRRGLTTARLAGHGGTLLPPLAEVVIDEFGDRYPELRRNRDAIVQTIAREEDRFSRTLDAGLELLTAEIEKTNDGTLPGEVAFRLHDTYGFPLDLTRDVASSAGLQVDVEGFQRLMDEQRERSRRVTEDAKAELADVRVEAPPTAFLGYDALEAPASVVAIVRGVDSVAAAAEGDEVDVVLDRTPFYAEGGGQVGDRGVLEGGEAAAEVLDTQKHGALHLHRVRVTSGELVVGAEVDARVDPRHRAGAERAHTATHVMHHQLRDTLGEHVRQMGSLVEPGRLRFDFSHFAGVGRDVLDEIEELVNRRISSDDEVRYRTMSYTDAIASGAMAFFEDKYGDEVRVVEVGEYSRELCGGTHVRHTGEVGLVKVLGEGSIGSNIRRVEALTGLEGLRWVNERLRRAERAAELLRVPSDELTEGVERLLRSQKELQRALDQQQRSGVAEAVGELTSQAREIGRGKLLVSRRPEAVGPLRELAVAVRDKLGRSVVILGTAGEGSANLVAAVSSDLVGTGIDARELLAPTREHIQGGGGGKPDLAMSGGRRPEGLDEALAAAAREAELALA